MESLNKLQTKNYIVDAIKNEILSGNMEPGEELAQTAVAEALGVSRMPVREALQQLEQEGFIVRLPNRHMQVADITEGKIKSVFRMISSMEYQLFCELLESKTDCPDLKEFIRSYQVKVEQGETAAAEEMEFHKKISGGLDNSYLTRIHHSMLDGYYAYVLGIRDAKDPRWILYMRKMLEAFNAGDFAAMKETLDVYFEAAAEILIAFRERSKHA